MKLPTTITIMILVGIGYVIGELVYFLNPLYLLLLIQVNELILSYHFYWELVTSILVTPSVVDCAFNEIALYLIYYLYRSREGKFELVIFFTTGIIGNVLYLITYPNGLPSAGASGGIFGLLAFYALYDFMKEREIGGLILLVVALVLSAVFLYPFLKVNDIAHIGGTLSGLLLSLLVYKLRNEQRSIT